MPIHDWSRVSDGMFHWFHQRWVGALSDWLNEGRLPQGFYAIGELFAEGRFPDVLAVEDRPPEKPGKEHVRSSNGAGVAIAESPPKARFTWEGEAAGYLARKDFVAIRNVEGILAAVIEIVSPGNKSSKARFQKFLAKTIAFLDQGVHVLVIDLFPPTSRDPNGIHQAIWSDFNGEFDFHPDKPLTVAAYMAGSEDSVAKAYAEPIAVGDPLPAMPLFLWSDFYVNVDLEATYASAWAVYPALLKPRIEGPLKE